MPPCAASAVPSWPYSTVTARPRLRFDRKAARLSQIETQLTTSSQPDPLEEFRGQPARTVWEGLSIARRRTVVQLLLASITIDRAGRRGSAFDPETIRVRWVEEALAA